jgi:hypothetical protein
MAGAVNNKKKFHCRYAKGMSLGRTPYKNQLSGLDDDTFDVGASAREPAKFSKLLKNIEKYIQKTYRSPDDTVKKLQQMKRAILSYLTTLKQQDSQFCDEDGNPYPDVFNMAVFARKEDYKSMKSRMDKYKDNESNAWALISDQWLPELENKLEGTEVYNWSRMPMTWQSC